jgi:hypothetical protein
MGKVVAVIIAAAVGLLVAGALGLFVGQAPVFQWEMAGLFLVAVAAAAGALAGAAGAASGKVGVGVAVGVLLGGAAWLLTSIENQQPAPLLFWGTVTAAAAAGVAGAIGGILGSRVGATSHPRM